MQALLVSTIVALLVYSNNFKSDYNDEDLGLATAWCAIVLIIVVISGVTGG